jgi:hypothetical protein
LIRVLFVLRMQTKYYTNNSIFEQNWSMANGGVVSLLNGELYDYLSKYRSAKGLKNSIIIMSSELSSRCHPSYHHAG